MSIASRLMLVLAFACMSLATLAQAQAPASAPVAKPAFDILEYEVSGNTTLPVVVIEKTVYPFLGEKKTIDDVEAARVALEAQYRERGYGTVTVSIPEQSVADGVVRLHVLEGRVEKLEVVGAKYFSQGKLLEKVPSLAEGSVPYFPAVKEELAHANDSPDEKVTPVLRPGKMPGTTDVDLEVDDHLPLHASVTLDNDYTPLTTAARLTGSIEYDNLFQAGQRLSLLYQTSPQNADQVKLWSVAYTIPVAGQFVALSLVRSDSASIAGVGGIDVFGRGSIIGVHDVIPLNVTAPTATHSFSQILNIGIDYKNFDQNVLVGSNANAGFDTPIRYLPMTVSYSAVLNPAAAEWDWGSSLEVAARNFGSDASDYDNKRYKALGNFVILKADLAHLQPLPYAFAVFGRVDLQLADQPLVSNEQMVVGGLTSVRGYLAASATGDSGARATLELRTPSLVSYVPWGEDDLSLHAFVDGAYVRIFSPLPEQIPSFTLLSSGVGLRAKANLLSDFSLDLAWPMRDVLYTRAWSPRLQASATVSF